MHKGLVLVSGGVDSATCLGLAVRDLKSENVVAVSVIYGQKHSRELECAKDLILHYGVEHRIIDLSAIYTDSNCSLLSHSNKEVPEGTYAEQQSASGQEKVDTYIPFRNGLMLSAVAALAQSMFPDDDAYIYIGAHADDAAGNAYADCSPEFTEAINRAIYLGTYEKVSIIAPLIHYNKAQVVELGLSLEVPYNLTTSCYNGGTKSCGRCGTCLDRISAFRANGVPDPIEYEGEDPFADMR